MLPYKLTMQAFGAYLNKTVIPFYKLNQNSIYLIGGATGSGKTTIFDAIMFALFNSTSGSFRSNSSLKSHYADENIKSFVEFEFIFNNEHYKIIKTPAYERKKQRGEGLIKVQPTAELHLPDSSIIIGNDNVDKYITDLLGLNAAQFSQIALLAQGEFLKLLNSDTLNRAEIFRTIFKTQNYSRFQTLLKEKLASIASNYQAKKQSIIQDISNFKTDESEILSEIEQIVKNNQFINLETLLNKFKIQNESDNKQNLKITKNIKDLTILVQNNSKTLDLIARKNNLISELNSTSKTLESLFLKEKEAQNALNNSKTLTLELEKNKIELNKLENSFKKVESIADSEKRVSSLEKSLVELTSALVETQTRIDETRLGHLKFLTLDLESCLAALKGAQTDFLTSKETYNTNSNNYNEKYNFYLTQQAGILAQNLTKNSPCPVCGSIEHPNPAKLTKDTISKTELDKLKQNLEIENEELRLKSQNCSILIEQSKIKEAELGKYKKLYKIEASLILAQNNFKNADFPAMLENLETKKLEITNQINDIKIIISGLKSAINTLKSDLKDIDIASISIKHTMLKEEIFKKEAKITEIKANFDNIELNLASQNSKLEVLKTQLDEFSEIDIATEEQLILDNSNLEQEITLLENENNLIISRFESNKRIFETLKKKNQEFLELEKQYLDFENLNNCANGTIKGRAKLAFEQYIQGYYLDLVLFEANKRFKIMTNSRFQLKRKKTGTDLKTKTGLEIEVMDFYTFKERSTKTLSGGESFMAALSLALGLSDVVANLAGAVNIDALFIDEGFGTLDNEALDAAMDVISELSANNRLIGLISHVDELKNRIENQIITKKSPMGSTIELNFE